MRLRNIPEAKDIVADSPYVIQEPALWRGRWDSLWKIPRPIHLEIGMGKGRFLMEMSLRHPETNYLGMELYDSVLLRALQKRQTMDEPLENLYFLCTDARTLTDLFGKNEIQKIYLNFFPQTERWSLKQITWTYLNFHYRKSGNRAGISPLTRMICTVTVP